MTAEIPIKYTANASIIDAFRWMAGVGVMAAVMLWKMKMNEKNLVDWSMP